MNPLLALTQYGQSYWLDDLTRTMIQDGSLRRRVEEEGLTGITSNPSTFMLAIADNDIYDSQIREAAAAGKSSAEIYDLLVADDIRNACDVLRPVYDRTAGADGYVSLEVSPHLAHDNTASTSEARRLFAAVGRPNLMIKIPGTKACLSTIEELLAEGINVNITLLFSIERYQAVANAYERALERRVKAGHSLENIASVASFFLSRIDVLVDELLAHRIRPDGGSSFSPHPKTLFGQVAVANAKVAYGNLSWRLKESEWQRLQTGGARPQRLLWASTSTKNPKYDDLMYVGPLIGPHTVNTMPPKTIEAFADHGTVAQTVDRDLDAAERTLEQLQALDIDLVQVTGQLEDEGIEKFIKAYDQLLESIEKKRLRWTKRDSIEALERAARQLRRDVIRMTTAAGSGHPTSCMSAADIVAALFFEHMRWDPFASQARNVDTFILSKGHAAPLLWAVLSRTGAIEEDPMTLRRIDSSLEGHPTPNNPWVKVATGSLGQGLCAANGMALANRLDGIDARIYCLLGDGECSEGSVWEAAQFASLNKLSNIVAIVDQNALGQSGATPYGRSRGVIAARFRAFGWNVAEIDGHDLYAVNEALRSSSKTGPKAIVAHTIKGKGVSFLEGAEGWHGKALDSKQCEQALAELGPDEECPRVLARRIAQLSTAPATPLPRVEPNYHEGEKVATRKAFGEALTALGAAPQVVVLDGDVMNSTYTELFAKQYPDRFFECYIAEQNMVGTALGLAVSGKTVVAATFACFLTRAYDFIRMAAHSRPKHLVFCGSHAGISIGEDGPSQMGLEDLAMFRALGESIVLCPSDAVSAERLTEAALRSEGIVYIRTARPATEVLYPNTAEFHVGGSKTLRQSDEDEATLVATGIAVYSALQAHDELRKQGVLTRVIDAYSVKPLDVESLRHAAEETRRIIVVEDHWLDGGLGDAVAAAVGGRATVEKLAVSAEPRSGTMAELFERYHISAHAVSDAVLAGGSRSVS